MCVYNIYVYIHTYIHMYVYMYVRIRICMYVYEKNNYHNDYGKIPHNDCDDLGPERDPRQPLPRNAMKIQCPSRQLPRKV